MMLDDIQLPEPYLANIRTAITILRQAGCREIYLFGSLVSGDVRKGSDIDLAIRGCPKNKFFHVWGKLFSSLEFPVDLVDLDGNDPFSIYLKDEGELVKIA